MSKKHHSAQSANSGRTAKEKHQGNQKRNLTALWIGLGIVVVLGAALLVAHPWVSANPPAALPTEITVAQAHDKYLAGALFVDVRTQAEWDQGHIANSVLIPLDELPNRLGELPKDRDVVVVCRSGARSKEGSTLLLQAGFTRVSCMTGGIQAWVAAGYTVTLR